MTWQEWKEGLTRYLENAVAADAISMPGSWPFGSAHDSVLPGPPFLDIIAECAVTGRRSTGFEG